MLLSIVVPVFREEKNIPEFLRRIRPILGEITQDYEIIFSMDPSPDRTEEVVLEERLTDPRIKLLKFSRRFGQPMATLAGMEYSRGDAVIVMDVDLQGKAPQDCPNSANARKVARCALVCACGIVRAPAARALHEKHAAPHQSGFRP
jgi:glycosyltransferase involved in cell wall biosynthesis